MLAPEPHCAVQARGSVMGWYSGRRSMLSLSGSFGDLGAGCEPKEKRFTTKSGKAVSFMARPSPKCGMSEALLRVRENLAAASAQCKRDMPSASVVERAKTCIGPALARKALPAPAPVEPAAPTKRPRKASSRTAGRPQTPASADRFVKLAVSKDISRSSLLTTYWDPTLHGRTDTRPGATVGTDGHRMHIAWGYPDPEAKPAKEGPAFQTVVDQTLSRINGAPEVLPVAWLRSTGDDVSLVLDLEEADIKRIVDFALTAPPEYGDKRVRKDNLKIAFRREKDTPYYYMQHVLTGEWSDRKQTIDSNITSYTVTNRKHPAAGFNSKYLAEALSGKTRARIWFGSSVDPLYVQDLSPDRTYSLDAIVMPVRV